MGPMETILNFVAHVLRRVLKLVLLVWVSLLALSVLLAVLAAVALSVLFSLLRGRKPALFTTFTQFRQASQQFRAGGWNRAGGGMSEAVAPADVVDVQAHEVREGARDGKPLTLE